jgi:hypothetical protein
MSRLSIDAGRLAAIGIGSTTALSSTALASQGPGTLPGTASGFTQIAMAVLVYGLCAVTVAVGLIGAARNR